MPTPLVTADTIAKTVTFTSKNLTDPTTYTGIVEGIVTYSLAGSFGFDMVAYNAAVQRADPTVGDPSTLNYFIITLANDQPAPQQQLFASEWIAPGSFSVIESATVYALQVYDLPANGLTALLGVLRAAGYNAVPTPTT